MKSKTSFFLYLLILPFLGLLTSCKKEVALPTVETSEIIARTTTSFYVRGRVNDSGGSYITEKGFVGCTIPNPSLQMHTYLTNQGGGDGYFERVVSSITPGIWYVKAYAINEAGVGYGNEKVINTIEESLCYKFTMEQDDYLYLAEIDPIPHEIFHDFGYYYGASSYYQNFDFRLQGHRLNKDDEGNYFDPELGAIFENQGTDAAVTEMYNRLLYDGLIEVLRQRFPNAQPKHGSYEIDYVVEFETFHDNWVIFYPFATYRCAASGNPPNFELVEWDSKSF